MNKNLLKILLAILLFMPLFTFAAFELEYVYPAVPGIGLSISADSSLGDVIKYSISWAIIIGAIIAFLSLIYAGIQYLSSTGRPEAMSQAKSRIFSSFLGLTILLGSYLILVTVNPQLIVMRIEKTPIVSGVVLLDTTSTNDLLDDTNFPNKLETLEKRINSKNAYLLRYDIKACQEEFGELIATKINTEVKEVNFENFELGGIGFLKDSLKGKAKVVFFEKEDFKGIAYEYTSEGLINVNGSIEGNQYVKDKGVMKIIKIDSSEPFFIPIHSNLSDINSAWTSVDRPPLSIQVENILPGVYLYSYTPWEEKYFTISKEDLRKVDFNDKTQKIGIKNDADHDFIAILHDDPYGANKMRIFFEKRTVKDKSGKSIIVGNIPTSTFPGEFRRIMADGIDNYGKLDKASSIYIFELAKEPSATSACSEVRLCTAPGFGEYCISYTPAGKEKSGISEIIARGTLPIYIPTNITKEVSVPKNGGTENIKFADNINSIYIEGACLVALFENSTSSDAAKYWEGDTPGSKSQIFTTSILDLSGEQINKCRTIKSLTFWKSISCASAIAIYPLKGFTFGGGEGGAGGAGASF